LQGKQEFEALMSQVMEARNQYLTDKTIFDQNWHNIKMPILVKIDPDLSPQDKINIAELIMNNPKCKVDGLIVSNTTNSRPLSLKSSLKHETGGLSGKPLKSLATQTISDMYKLTNGNYV
jgi:dihydroorotate dehydrogenase